MVDRQNSLICLKCPKCPKINYYTPDNGQDRQNAKMRLTGGGLRRIQVQS